MVDIRVGSGFPSPLQQFQDVHEQHAGVGVLAPTPEVLRQVAFEGADREQVRCGEASIVAQLRREVADDARRFFDTLR